MVTASRPPCLEQIPPAPKHVKRNSFSSEAQQKQPSSCPWGRRTRQRHNPQSVGDRSEAVPLPSAPCPNLWLRSRTKYLLK